jgi:hypothetical protein
MNMMNVIDVPKITTNECPPAELPSQAAAVAVEWKHTLGAGTVDRAVFTFTERRTGEQTRAEIEPGLHRCISLAAGPYRVVAAARGLELYRDTFELSPGQIVPVRPVLNPRPLRTPELADLFAKFLITPRESVRDLEVPTGRNIVLDATNPEFKRDAQTVAIKDIETAKRMLGNADALWGAGEPRFSSPVFSRHNSPAELARTAAREYVYGNSATVAQWSELINRHVFDEAAEFFTFGFGTVTINPRATLTLGVRSHVLLCRRLRIHATGTLLIRGTGPVHVEPLEIEAFC